VKRSRGRWLLLFLGVAFAASAEAQSRLRVAERRELESPGTLVSAAGPGVVAGGANVVVSGWSLSRSDPKSLEVHLWLFNDDAEKPIYIHPRLDVDTRLKHALFLGAFPLPGDKILALFALDHEALGIVEVTREGGVRVIATPKRPWGDVEVRRLIRARDGSFVAVGRAESAPFALRFRDDGEILWSNVRRGVAQGYWTDVEERLDGSLLLVGQMSDSKDFAGGRMETVLAEVDAHGKLLHEARQEAVEAIVVGPAERPMLLARDAKSKVWSLRALATSTERASERSIAGELRWGGWLARAAHLADGSAALSEVLPGLQADIAVVRADGAVVRSEPIAGIIPAPSAFLAPGPGGSVMALFSEVPRKRAEGGGDGGVEGGLVLVKLELGK
jgi:hypothetical protein